MVRPKPAGATANNLAHVEPPTDPVWVVPPDEKHLFEPSGESFTKLQLEKEVEIISSPYVASLDATRQFM